jgi:hypothetical protein
MKIKIDVLSFGAIILWEKGTLSPFPSKTMSILIPIPAKL